MDDSQRVGVVEAGGHAAQILERRTGFHRSLLHPARKAATGDVLDDHVGRSLVFAEVEYVDDVGVAHLGDGLRLMTETGSRVSVGRYALQDFDGTGALELHVIGAVNDAHGPLADEVLDLVLAQPGSGLNRHGQ